MVTLPDVTLNLVMGNATCGQLELGGLGGYIDATQCSFLVNLVGPCACAPAAPTAPAVAAPAVSPAPVAAPSPVVVAPSPVVVAPSPIVAPTLPPNPGYPACSICGAGKTVTANITLSLPIIGDIGCYLLQEGALSGLVSPDNCTLLQFAVQQCACAPEAPAAPAVAAPAVSPAPVAAAPVAPTAPAIVSPAPTKPPTKSPSTSAANQFALASALSIVLLGITAFF